MTRYGMGELLTVLVVVAMATVATAQELKPGEAMDYGKLAFFPQRWEDAQVSTKLIPWEGKQIVLLTTSRDFDAKVMARFVSRLDAGWKLYGDLTGRTPSPQRQFNGKATIAAVPNASLTCGYGCGYVGATGIEISGFYRKDYALVASDRDAFPHYLFYEMGRNYYTFGDRHSLFITGYAVFMRYVCMDSLECTDRDPRTRATIEWCESVYAASEVPFLSAFTNLPEGEKRHRLKDAEGRTISPSDQPVMYATAMLKLYKDHGGNAWLKRFFRQLQRCPRVKVQDSDDALDQCLNWVVAASAAAGQDLTPVFVDRWRMPMNAKLRAALAKVDWSIRGIDAGRVIKRAKARAARGR